MIDRGVSRMITEARAAGIKAYGTYSTVGKAAGSSVGCHCLWTSINARVSGVKAENQACGLTLPRRMLLDSNHPLRIR